MKEFFGKITGLMFKQENSTPSHVALNIMGIKIKYLRREIRSERKNLAKLYRSFDNITLVPKARGNLRLIQEANANLLGLFDKMCTEMGLSYWLNYGTLLGAIRHKGFIPWDDDIDVGMTREDYNRMIQLFDNELKNCSDIELVFENNNKNKCFAKIKHKASDNLFIDIFPYDFYYSKLDKKEKQDLSTKIVKYRKGKLFKRYKNAEEIRKNFEYVTKTKILDNKTVDLNIEPAIFMGIDFPHLWKNMVYDWDNIFPLKRILFEGREFLSPNEPEEVLKILYGNYMNIPKDPYPRHTRYIDMADYEKKFLEEFIQNE